MVLTRSRKARDTQWTRDAVLNNPDLLCHIAEQADLPTACKLLTTSKRNFIGPGAVFFRKQYDYYDKQYNFFWDKSEPIWDEYDRLGLAEDFCPYLSVEHRILRNERIQVLREYCQVINQYASTRGPRLHFKVYLVLYAHFLGSCTRRYGHLLWRLDGPVTRRYRHLL
jgi:hypothetical protein